MTATTTLHGEPISVEIPVSADDITYAQFCDYQQAENYFIEANADRDNNDIDHIAAALAEAVAIVCGPGVHDLPFSEAGQRLDEMIKSGFQIGFDSDLTVMSLYAHLTVLLKTANYHGDLQPESIPAFLVIDHNGKSYRVIGKSAARVMTGNPISVGEAVEAAEYRRRHSNAVKARVQDGSALDFTLGLSEFAILVRRPGERLPADDEKRERWIVERRKLLADLPMTDVLKVRFFLTAALLKLANADSTGSSTKDRPVLIGLPGRKRNGKRGGNVRRWLNKPGK